MGKKKLRKLLEELGETVNRNITCEKDWRAANETLAAGLSIALSRIKDLEEKLRFALVNAKAPPGKILKWGDVSVESEPYSTMPMGAQEKLGCVPIEAPDVSLVDIPNPAP